MTITGLAMLKLLKMMITMEGELNIVGQGQNESEYIVLSGLWEWRYSYDNEGSNWVEYDIDVNRKFYYENIPFNF
tara:strand:- start:1372 stop:1596 length:225 start_codon:yes stop_codon:yes gene_type:complete